MTRAIRLRGSGMVSFVSSIRHSSCTLTSFHRYPQIFDSRTLATEIVSDTPSEIVFKLRQEYSPKGLSFSKPVNSLVSLALDEQGKVKYHKDMWNEKDYSHEGLGKLMKNLNGDYLTKITKPPESLSNVYKS